MILDAIKLGCLLQLNVLKEELKLRFLSSDFLPPINTNHSTCCTSSWATLSDTPKDLLLRTF